MQYLCFSMDYNSRVVAEGTASATMVYEFQKSFLDTAGLHPSQLRGRFVSLDDLLALKKGGTAGWTADTAVTGETFRFSVTGPGSMA